MNNWKINVLNIGNLMFMKNWLTDGVDVDVPIKMPFLAFLIDNGRKKFLVDNGISEKYIVDGKGWGGNPAEGGSQYVLRALDEVGVKPDQIEAVLYTHLHNDHAGAAHLFKDSVHVFQEDEWKTLCTPNPRDIWSKGYDWDIIPLLKELKYIRLEGDLEIEPGLRIYKTPGHTPGGQSVAVDTANGTYVILGDNVYLKCNLFTKMDKMTLLDGSELKITPYPDPYAPASPVGRAGLIRDYDAWYASIFRMKLLIKGEEYALPGHEPSIAGKAFG